MKLKAPEGWGGMWKVVRALERYKYILLVVLAGAVLMLLPGKGGAVPSGEKPPEQGGGASFYEQFDLIELEARMRKTLSAIAGAGSVEVLLTLEASTEQVLARESNTSSRTDANGESAENTNSALVLGKSGGAEEAVVIRQTYPRFRGALVVCEGADDAIVRLQLTQAVSALTGLGTDKITISKMKER